MIVTEDGDPVEEGEVGEIVARGPRMMTGYWGQEDATRDTLKGGWLYTGDLAWQDEDGYIYLAGRARDFIKRGGEMISPEEVETILADHPGVAEAAVIGVPDLDWGEEVKAVVVASDPAVTEQELMDFCRDRLAGFKRPRSVVFVDELPRNVMGKVLKRDLRAEFGDPATGTCERKRRGAGGNGMDIAVMGAGGVGGYFGGLLARAGHNVTFIARGPHLEAIRRDGLRVESGNDGIFTVPGNATDDPASVGPQELVLFTVKMYDNDDAIRAIAPMVGRTPSY